MFFLLNNAEGTYLLVEVPAHRADVLPFVDDPTRLPFQPAAVQ